MNINFAHLRARAINGGWIDFAVFAANAHVFATDLPR